MVFLWYLSLTLGYWLHWSKENHLAETWETQITASCTDHESWSILKVNYAMSKCGLFQKGTRIPCFIVHCFILLHIHIALYLIFTNRSQDPWRQDFPPAKRSWFSLLLHSFCYGGLKQNLQYLSTISVLWQLCSIISKF